MFPILGFRINRTQLLKEMTDSRCGVGNIQDEHRTHCHGRKKGSYYQKLSAARLERCQDYKYKQRAQPLGIIMQQIGTMSMLMFMS